MGKKKPAAKSPPRETSPGRAGIDNEREIVSQVWELAEPLCAAEGVELIHIEYQRESGGRILRVYIEKPGGVSLDDCSAVSQQLSDILDIKLETEATYTLEVSSPGPSGPCRVRRILTGFGGIRQKSGSRRRSTAKKISPACWPAVRMTRCG